MKQMKHPIQPLQKDELGTVRFKMNKIVRYLLDSGGLSLNDIATKSFDADELQQFSQLIGYSLSGYGDLNYVDDLAYNTAENMKQFELDEKDARIVHLENLIKSMKNQLREPMAELFEIHPDDLN